MRKDRSNRIVTLVIFATFTVVSGGHKKVASAPAVTRPPQPARAAPTVAPPMSPSTTRKGRNQLANAYSESGTAFSAEHQGRVLRLRQIGHPLGRQGGIDERCGILAFPTSVSSSSGTAMNEAAKSTILAWETAGLRPRSATW